MNDLNGSQPSGNGFGAELFHSRMRIISSLGKLSRPPTIFFRLCRKSSLSRIKLFCLRTRSFRKRCRRNDSGNDFFHLRNTISGKRY